MVLIKQIGGQGAMHDNRILPDEPSGFAGGHSNIDLGNVPIILSPNEYRRRDPRHDLGGAMGIGPSTKRPPASLQGSASGYPDKADIDLLGVVLVGTPQTTPTSILSAPGRLSGRKPCGLRAPSSRLTVGETPMWTTPTPSRNWASATFP